MYERADDSAYAHLRDISPAYDRSIALSRELLLETTTEGSRFQRVVEPLQFSDGPHLHDDGWAQTPDLIPCSLALENIFANLDAVPSIFPWITKDKPLIKIEMEDASIEKELNNSKESEGDSLEAIRKFIEDEQNKVPDPVPSTSNETMKVTTDEKVDEDGSKDFDERLAVASSMLDVIVSETEEQIAKKKDGKHIKNNSSPADKGNNGMALSVGSKVEARDFGDYWYPAQIVEVDYEEMEVLVHYENSPKRHDEWISVSSPRLRPLNSSKPSSPTPAPLVNISSARETAPFTKSIVKLEPKVLPEEKKLMFVVGERCLARWRDNRRFTATISKDLGDGVYEIVFDDGFQWKCPNSRLYKMKDPVKIEGLKVDTTTSNSTTSMPSPVQYGAGPSSTLPNVPAFHTHLFDPTRDYLGSKSERREMKRKLNIKEIFNIGQKKKRTELKPKEPNDMVVGKKRKYKRNKPEEKLATTVKKEIPDAVASIIGTVKNEEPVIKKEIIVKEEIIFDKDIAKEEEEVLKEEFKEEENPDASIPETGDDSDMEESETYIDPVQKEEVKLEKFEKVDDSKHEEVIDRIKEVINKLEDGIYKVQNSPKPEVKQEMPKQVASELIKTEVKEADKDKSRKLAKVKKGKKLRLLQEKRVKKEVEQVKSELEEMKRQVEEMRKQMQAKTEALAKETQEMPESFLLPGEWCCKWINGQPVGKVSELEGEVRDGNSKPGLPRRSVQVEDKRLPPGWTKHMVRRSLGNSAGKWDVVLISPDNRRFHTKTDMRNYIESDENHVLRDYEHALMDFGVHLKLARRMGWFKTTPGGVDETPVVSLPAGTLCSTSPLVKRRPLSLKKIKKDKGKRIKSNINIRMPKYLPLKTGPEESANDAGAIEPALSLPPETSTGDPPLEDGFVYVGSLKVQIIENLLRCPAESCFKNFRNNTLLKMHIKHYHRELKKMLGRTPKVLDLAYARTMPTSMKQTKRKHSSLKSIKIKVPRLPKRADDAKPELKEPESLDPQEILSTPVDTEETAPRLQDSPKLRHALINKPVKRPRVLLPVRRPDPELEKADSQTDSNPEIPTQPVVNIPLMDSLDFETAISTHTVTKPLDLLSKKKDKKGKVAVLTPKLVSEDEDWYAMTSDVETRSSFPRSGTPDSKNMELKMPPLSSESIEAQKEVNDYMYSENGERIKIVHMKREEIINCHCGFREEDGLMVQCELCLCWQHALCHNIQKESEVPEKYTCSICLNPRRGRRSQRFLHDQDRLYEGLLPGARPSEPLRRSHELCGNLLRLQDALHALRVKYCVHTKKDHPKLYLWAKDWENGELNISQDRLNAEYSDLNLMISSIGKENLPVGQHDLKDVQMDMQTPPSEDHERYNHRDSQMGSQALLSGLLSSPGGASLDLPLPLSASELERLASTVQDEVQRASAPQPEAAIENSACRERLLRHIQRCQAVIDARLDSIEAQVAELESQDPSFEDDETADYFPRTKQTIQMLMRDLDTMEELGVIT
ncbi:hypothetical protein evm_008317 [Chilo suppressalis]|nr:hypothetical protein evm_008317 [Chilo suppressalis]